MATDERVGEVLSLLEERKKISVRTLAKTLYVSEMTVRRLLREMEADHLLTRYHGGAMKIDSPAARPIRLRTHVDEAEKKNLAAEASAFLGDRMTVFLDSSSTVSFLVPYLKEYRDLTVLTNSVRTLLLLEKIHVGCILIGGNYYEPDMCLKGPVTESTVRNYRPDLAFFTTTAISADGMITDLDEQQCHFKKTVILQSEKAVALYTKQKQGLVHPFCMGKADDLGVTVLR